MGWPLDASSPERTRCAKTCRNGTWSWTASRKGSRPMSAQKFCQISQTDAAALALPTETPAAASFFAARRSRRKRSRLLASRSDKKLPLVNKATKMLAVLTKINENHERWHLQLGWTALTGSRVGAHSGGTVGECQIGAVDAQGLFRLYCFPYVARIGC